VSRGSKSIKSQSLKEKKSPAFKTFSHGGVLSINQLLTLRRAALNWSWRVWGTSTFSRMNQLNCFLVS